MRAPATPEMIAASCNTPRRARRARHPSERGDQEVAFANNVAILEWKIISDQRDISPLFRGVARVARRGVLCKLATFSGMAGASSFAKAKADRSPYVMC